MELCIFRGSHPLEKAAAVPVAMSFFVCHEPTICFNCFSDHNLSWELLAMNYLLPSRSRFSLLISFFYRQAVFLATCQFRVPRRTFHCNYYNSSHLTPTPFSNFTGSSLPVVLSTSGNWLCFLAIDGDSTNMPRVLIKNNWLSLTFVDTTRSGQNCAALQLTILPSVRCSYLLVDTTLLDLMTTTT